MPVGIEVPSNRRSRGSVPTAFLRLIRAAGRRTPSVGSSFGTINIGRAPADTPDKGSLRRSPGRPRMKQPDDDSLVPFGDMPVFTGMWSLVALVVLATAICM